MVEGLSKLNNLKSFIETFIDEEATHKFSIDTLFGINSVDDILEVHSKTARSPTATNDDYIYITYQDIETLKYESGSGGVSQNNYDLYIITNELYESNLPERLITMAEELSEALLGYNKGAIWFDRLEPGKISGNTPYFYVSIIY